MSGKKDETPAKSIEEILKLLALGEELNESQRKQMKDYKFWKTQPVPSLDEKITKEGPIDVRKKVEDISSKPLPLIEGFEWSTLDLSSSDELDEVYELLYEHYVEDKESTLRLKYSHEFFKWALQPPGWRSDWYVGVRVKETRKLVGFISAIPSNLKLTRSNTDIKSVEINFLCIHKKLRSKRLAPVLIKEITRRVNKCDIWQAMYTGGSVLPSPVSTCRYTHRPINWSKLYDVGFSHLPAGQTKASMVARYAMPNTTKMQGFRKMEKKDIPQVLKLYNEFQKKFEVIQTFDEEEISHWFLGNSETESNVIKSYVVENEEGRITDYVTYYLLPFSILDHPVHEELGVAYLFYYGSESGLGENINVPFYKARLCDLMNDAMVTSKKFDIDVFNCLTAQDNSYFIQRCKFGAGNGFLNYYLFNYSTLPVNGGIDPKTKELLEDVTSGIGVILF